MRENKNLPMLGTEKNFNLIKGRFCSDLKHIEFVDMIPNLDEYVMNYTKWDVSEAQDGSIMAWITHVLSSNKRKASKHMYEWKLMISGNGTILANKDCSYLFSDFKKVETIQFNGLLDTRITVSTSYMFSNLEHLKEIDLSKWNMRNLKDASAMFAGCEKLRNVDISNWNTQNLQDTGVMFVECEKLRKVDLSEWNTQNLQDTFGMFAGCCNLKKIDVANWNTQKLENTCEMFFGCQSLINVDISNWDTQNLKDASGMFKECKNLEKVITDDERIIEQIEGKCLIKK